MEEPSATPAPAQPAADPVAAVESTSATEAPASFSTYASEADKADRARLTGKPVPAAEPAAPIATDEDAPAVDAKGQQIRGADGKFVSKRQHANNERIRDAVERGISEERRGREAAEGRARDLEARLSALERGTQPAKPAEPAAPPADTGKPKWADFEAQIPAKYASWGEAQEAFVDARDDWKDAQTRATAARADAVGTVDRVIADHQGREADLTKTVADYGPKTLALREQLDRGLAAGAPLVLPLLESPKSAHLILHLAEHPAEFERIGRLGATNLPAALRELGKLEARFDAEPAAAPAPAITRKTVTSAPEPPTTLGTRSAEPADAKAAALAKKDFRTWKQEADQRDLATAPRR